MRYQQQHGGHTSELMNYPPLEKITRGDCIICKEPNLLEEDIEEIKIKQESCFKNNEEMMRKLEKTNTKEKT